MIRNLWWTWFPSCNIRVYYRMMDFVLIQPRSIQIKCLETAFEKCNPREQRFLREKGLYADF